MEIDHFERQSIILINVNFCEEKKETTRDKTKMCATNVRTHKRIGNFVVVANTHALSSLLLFLDSNRNACDQNDIFAHLDPDRIARERE